VSASLAASVRELETNAYVQGVVKSDRAEQQAQVFWRNSHLRREFMKRMFHLLRSRVRRQRRICAFSVARRQRSGTVVKRVVFLAWKEYRRVMTVGAQLQRWRQRRVKGAALDHWLRAYAHQSYAVPAAQQLARGWALRHAFGAFKRSKELALRNRALEIRQSLVCTLFLSIRVFRAWKALAQQGRQLGETARRELQRRRTQRLLDLWYNRAHLMSVRNSTHSLAVQQRRQQLSVGAHFVRWRRMYKFRLNLCLYRCKRRYFLRLLKRLAAQSRQRGLLESLAHPRSTAMRRCLSRWAHHAWAARSLRRARKALLATEAARVLQTSWSAWRGTHLRCGHMYRAAQVVLRRDHTALLERCLSAWWTAFRASNTQRALGNVRDRWLGLFSEDKAAAPAPQGVRGSLAQVTATSQIAPVTQERGVSRAQRSRQRVKGRLLALGPGELQMLSWESDSSDGGGSDREGVETRVAADHNSEDGAHEGAHPEGAFGKEGSRVLRASVLCRRYLYRWHLRSRQRKALELRAAVVKLSTSRAVVRRSFGTIVSVWLAAMSAGRNQYAAALRADREAVGDSGDARLVRNSLYRGNCNLFVCRHSPHDGARVQAERSADLHQLADDLSLGLTTARQEQDQRAAVVRDLDSSLQALGRERAAIAERVAAARRYSRSVQDRREELLQQRQLQQQAPPSVQGSSVEDSHVAALSSLIDQLSASDTGSAADEESSSLVPGASDGE
jgi:outer membrane murein-binding lipoprotein Lpp